MSVKHVRLEVDNGTFVHVVIKESKIEKKDCIVFSHGFSVSGFESRRMFWDISDELNALGYVTILFDYRGSGYSDLSFSKMTIDTEIQDLKKVIEYVYNNINGKNSFFLWGQSFGSGVASLVTPKHPEVKALILWCLSAELYDRYLVTLGNDIFCKGHVYLESGFKVYKSFLDSLKNKDVYEAIKKINIPLLLIHGTADQKASVKLSQKAFQYANNPKELFIIENGNHGFKNQPDLFEKAKQKTFDWIQSLDI